MEDFYFDPRIMISKPYIDCPKCKEKTFGVLIISDDHYCRRCKSCLFPQGHESSMCFSLPKLNKKVIYLDQFAISNMMKVINPKTNAYKSQNLDPFWLKLFERLDSLCKQQLIICPDSEFHRTESLTSDFYKPLKRMYELLSHGVTFYDHAIIKRFQVQGHFKNWIFGKQSEEINLNLQKMFHGKINAWQDRLIISIDNSEDVDIVKDIRKFREQSYESLKGVFNIWQQNIEITFNTWFEHECTSYGKTVIKVYLDYLNSIFSENVTLNFRNLHPSSSVLIINEIHRILKECGYLDEYAIMEKTIEYLTSTSIQTLPFLRISACLFASLARQAGAGRKKPPNQGTANDIEIVSCYLPYCNAMFIDNECAKFLKESPVSERLNFKTNIYSQSNREEFLSFLDEIEKSASKRHLEKVKEVYGDSWKEPYITLYKNE